MPVIHVMNASPSDRARKRELIAELTATYARVMRMRPDTVRVIIHEIDRDSWGVGGVTLSDSGQDERVDGAGAALEPRGQGSVGSSGPARSAGPEQPDEPAQSLGAAESEGAAQPVADPVSGSATSVMPTRARRRASRIQAATSRSGFDSIHDVSSSPSRRETKSREIQSASDLSMTPTRSDRSASDVLQRFEPKNPVATPMFWNVWKSHLDGPGQPRLTSTLDVGGPRSGGESHAEARSAADARSTAGAGSAVEGATVLRLR